MQGNLTQTPLPEVLQFISMANNSGVLTIRDRQGGETKLTITKGRVINSSTLDRRRRLGELLVQRGLIRRSELAHLLNLQRTVESDKRLGQLLAERDMVPREVVEEVLRAQVEEEIWGLFGLAEGDFHYEIVDDKEVGEPQVEIHMGPLLIEGTRRQDEWRSITKLLPHDQLVIGLTEKGLELAEMEDPPKFTLQQWRVLAQVNGRFSIRAIVNRSQVGSFHVFQILRDSLEEGFVEVRPHPAATEGEPVNQVAARSSAGGGNQLLGRGVSGIFSRFAGGAKKNGGHEALEFVSPVGSLAHLVTRAAEKLLPAVDSPEAQNGEPVLETLWAEILPQFTRADLVYVEGNTVRVDAVEHFFQYFEFGNAVIMTYEDCLEALLHLLDAAYRLGSNRNGEKAAVRVMRELLDEIVPRVRHTYASDFKFGEQVQSVLRLAA